MRKPRARSWPLHFWSFNFIRPEKLEKNTTPALTAGPAGAPPHKWKGKYSPKTSVGAYKPAFAMKTTFCPWFCTDRHPAVIGRLSGTRPGGKEAPLIFSEEFGKLFSRLGQQRGPQSLFESRPADRVRRASRCPAYKPALHPESVVHAGTVDGPLGRVFPFHSRRRGRKAGPQRKRIQIAANANSKFNIWSTVPGERGRPECGPPAPK